ncbi:1-acyl-sn-glycerol-3-phosphateacetyltransferase [Corynebacterium deserti GIMN1.010]|uniref:1-acyl-sn-glycerol-3-phosphateacetyltransferase n=1 Tax=Corynebacterium deserti GIMN1.010 TaxID=931089 RepID=A0A0M4CEN2_9CORY|nr:lysophospholipid acyltransferase family protein [Corynebacterium deserti]ALC06366.1 1-acyl-sn-glycerol-3-phosphateacetyltransferase [Corynebacterium deserti GIMN1.010]
MKNNWYWFFKYVLVGPFLRVYNRPKIDGKENIPAEGPAIMASNHQAVMDSFYFPLLCPRQLTFPAKAEYFTSPGLKGKFQKWFFTSVGQVPLDRTADNAMDSLMNTAKSVLGRGDLFGIYPEGSRSPDGRIYKGKTGMAYVAMETGVRIIPVAMIGSRNANPIGSWFPRPAKVRVKIGTPIDPLKFVADKGLEAGSHEAARQLTDHVMFTLADLTGEPYVDAYSKDVKDSLEAGHGFPKGTEPRG